jgi:hypothetical protein
LAVRLYEPGRAVIAKIITCNECAKHTEREVGTDIIVTRDDKGPAETPASGAEIEDAG